MNEKQSNYFDDLKKRSNDVYDDLLRGGRALENRLAAIELRLDRLESPETHVE